MKPKENFSQLISKARKKKNLTQQELATLINISDKAISSWENERNIPDIEIIKSLEKVLDIKLLEKEETKKNKILKKIFISLTSILSIIFFILLIYFINNYNRIRIYDLSLESNYFYINNSSLTIIEDRLTIETSYLYNKQLPYQPSYRVTLYYLEGNKKYQLETKNNYNSFYIEGTSKEVLNNLDNLYLNIKYTNYQNKLINENIKIKLTDKANTNKLFYKNNPPKQERINQNTLNLLHNNNYNKVDYYTYKKEYYNTSYQYNILDNTMYIKTNDNNLEYYILKELNRTNYVVIKDNEIIEYNIRSMNNGKEYLSKIEEISLEYNKLQIN